MSIVSPGDDSLLVSPSAVALQGHVDDAHAIPLYFRWYSSLHPATENHYSLNETALTDAAQVLQQPLAAGTHVLTFAASDQPGQDNAAQAATRNGGVAGGAKGPSRCVVHVLRAVLRTPSGAALSKAGAKIDAEGPALWGDTGYQALNRLHYHLSFEPSPADGRAGADLDPVLTVVEGGSLRFEGPLPAQLGTGGYVLRLRVQDSANAATFAEDTRAVVIAA